MFLGGDALYAKLLAWLLGCPEMAFMPRVYPPQDFVRIFVPTQAERDRAVAKGGEPEKIVVVPTLALDSIRPSAPLLELRTAAGSCPKRQGRCFPLLAWKPAGIREARLSFSCWM